MSVWGAATVSLKVCNCQHVTSVEANINCTFLLKLLLSMLSLTCAMLAGAKVIFSQGTEAASHANNIIECSWDAQNQAWSYMRERHDKATPNAWRVYEKVVQSIADNITPAALLKHIANTVSSSDAYQKERQR